MSMTKEEIKEAAKAIAKLRPEPKNKRVPKKSLASDIERYQDQKLLQSIEAGEDVEVPSHRIA